MLVVDQHIILSLDWCVSMIMDDLASRVGFALRITAPVLSGSMKQHMQLVSYTPDEVVYEIDAPFYDTNKWAKTGVIEYTGADYGGITAYAKWLNDMGAFGSGNSSRHWINRILAEICSNFANEIGGEFINELGL